MHIFNQCRFNLILLTICILVRSNEFVENLLKETTEAINKLTTQYFHLFEEKILLVLKIEL